MAPELRAEFSRRCIGLNPELLKCLNGWLDDLDVFTSVRTRIREVVDSVEKKDVIENAIAIHVESALEVHRSQPRRRRSHPWRKFGELVVVPSIQRQFHDL